jgi:hypothetical protein
VPNDTIIQLISLLEDMRPTMKRCGIDNKFIVFSKCDKLPGYAVEDALIWIQDLYKGPYAACQQIRRLLSEDLWDKYKLWGEFDEHRECILYSERLAIFKAACKQRPLIFKHTCCEKAITENNRKKPKNKAKKEVSNEE